MNAFCSIALSIIDYRVSCHIYVHLYALIYPRLIILLIFHVLWLLDTLSFMYRPQQ